MNASDTYPKATRCDECGDKVSPTGCPTHPGTATFAYPEAPAVEVSKAAAVLGRRGGAAGRGAAKRRDVDYRALGAAGGRAGRGAAKRRHKRQTVTK